MRIVAVADTHTFEQDLGDLPEGDVFVHLGDIVRGGDLSELAAPARWMRSLPHQHKIVIAGNHDWCFVREQKAARALLGDGITYLQDSGCVIGTTFANVTTWESERGATVIDLSLTLAAVSPVVVPVRDPMHPD